LAAESELEADIQTLEKHISELEEEPCRAKWEDCCRIELEELKREVWVPKGRKLCPITALEMPAGSAMVTSPLSLITITSEVM